MENPIKCGKYRFNHLQLTGSTFNDVCLGNTEFENVSLAGARFNNINMSDMQVSCVQWGGTRFKDIGLPPAEEFKDQKQRPLQFENCDLNSSIMVSCDLKGVELIDCDTKGMKINGVLVSDLLAAYEDKEG